MRTPDAFLDVVKHSGPIPVYKIIDGSEFPISNLRVRADLLNNYTRAVLSHTLVTMDAQSQNVVNERVRITRQHVNNFYNFVENNSYTPSQYRQVKNHQVWRAFYDIQPYSFPKKNKQRDLYLHLADGTSCRKCEYLMPLRNLTVDHQRPQAGGEILAVLRVFRGLGLTSGGPKLNGKNANAMAQHATNVGGVINQASKDGSNTTNDAGTLYYSVFKALGELNSLKEKCMHHYLNLRPLCGPCNSSLSNRNVF